MNFLIRNLIFDWSGTLSNDWALVYKGSMKVFSALGIKKIPLKKFREEFELPYMKFYRKYLPHADKKIVDIAFLAAMQRLDDPKPFAGARKILSYLAKRQKKVVVLSSLPQLKLEREIKNDGFSQYFLVVKGSVHDKTVAIRSLMKQSRFKASETAYVGDMRHDIEAGKKARVKTIGVTWGYKSKRKLQKASPDVIINQFEQIKKIF